MSWQAQTAVNHHSKQQKLHLFKLMGYLADVADASGAIAMAPAQSTLATFYNVSDRTVRNWLDELIASGELTQTRIGSGPGNPSAYQINLPMPAGKVEEITVKVETKVEKVEEITAFLSTFAQQLDEIKVEINQLKASTFATKGGKGGNERWKRWKRKVETTSRGGAQTSQDQTSFVPVKEEKKPPTPQPAPAFPFKPARKNKNVTAADARVAMIIRVCGLDVTIPDHVRQAQNAAAQLANYTSEVIQARYTNLNGATGEGWNWYRDDWRGQRGNMPRPAQVVETISQERVMVAPEVRQNGNGPADGRPNISKAAASYAEKRRRLLGNQHE